MGASLPGAPPPPGDPKVTTARTLRDPAIFAAVGVGAVALLHVRDPHDSTYITCPFLFLTGQPCPGCGSLRAVNLLTNGEFVAAASSNLLALALVVLLPVMWLRWSWRLVRGDRTAQFLDMSNRTIVVASVLVVIFWIARLTPWGSWLAP